LIAMLKGAVAHHEGTRAILDVRGVGYEVFAPSRSIEAWRGEDEVTVWVATRVREDAFQLFGFADDIERQAFDVLTSVTGVGPKMALAALDTLTVDELVRAVETDDHRSLCKVAGVGKKKAQRLALELKGKLPVGFTPTAGGRPPRPVTPDDPLPLALAQLDYGKSEIDRARAALEEQGLGEDQPLQARLQAALRYLSGR
jgi:Holliday junction DNA helicase RuvA